MALSLKKKTSSKRIVRIQASSLAAYEGTFAAILGLGVAILHSLNASVRVADSTDSVLRGLAFGLASGVVSVIVLPFVYFAIGWVFGLLHAFVFNVVLGASGGLVLDLEDE